MRYRNMGTVHHTVRNTDGYNIDVKPGAEVDSYLFGLHADLVLIDATGLFNPVAAITEITLGAATDYILQTDTTIIIVLKITGTITIRPQVDTAVPLILNMTVDDPIIKLDRPYTWYDRLRISGTGTCTIMEYRDF